MDRFGGSSGPDSASMIHLGTQPSRDAAGFTVKHCVLCLTNRLHLVEVSSSEFAGFTYATKAFLVCTRCGGVVPPDDITPRRGPGDRRQAEPITAQMNGGGESAAQEQGRPR